MKKKLLASNVTPQGSNIIVRYMYQLLYINWEVYKFGTMASLLQWYRFKFQILIIIISNINEKILNKF